MRVIGGPVSIGFDFRCKIHVASGHDVSGTGAIGIGRVVRDLGRRGTGVGLLRLCGCLMTVVLQQCADGDCGRQTGLR